MRKPCVILFLIVLAAGAIYGVSCRCESSPAASGRAEFDKRYAEWHDASAQWARNHFMSGDSGLTETVGPLLEMGPAAIPYIIERMEAELRQPRWGNRGRSDHINIIRMISQKHFAKPDYPAGKFGDPDVAMRLYIKWWREERRSLPTRFAARFNKWDQSQRKRDIAKAEESLDQLRDMGIEILPLVMAKIQAGDTRLVPFVSRIMRKDVGKTRQEVLAWWKANEAKLRLPDPPPAATDTKPAKNK